MKFSNLNKSIWWIVWVFVVLTGGVLAIGMVLSYMVVFLNMWYVIIICPFAGAFYIFATLLYVIPHDDAWEAYRGEQ